MSGVASGIGKVFSAVGSAAARVGKAVMGVGATTFTAGAATGAGSIASGGLAGVVQNFTGTGVIGNILTGAITQAGYGALVGGAIGAMTGTGFGKGALMGAAAGGISGGLFGAAGLNPDPLTAGFGQAPQSGVIPGQTPTGMTPTGGTSSAPLDLASSRVAQAHSPVGGVYTPEAGFAQTAPAAAPAATGGGGFGKFLSSEAGGGLLAGLGKGYGSYMEAKQREESAEADRQFLRERDQRITDSYDVGAEALHAPTVTDNSARPLPSKKYGRTRYQYDAAAGRVIQVPA